MDNKPLCAVWVVTYNQKDFIAQTIESIVNQKTTFPFKAYIGDDYSSDGTKEICFSYKAQYPHLIELLLNSSNRMQQNSSNVFKACLNSGAKYIAMCEGDDYWTDEYKLQKQVSFLEQNPGFSICFHNSKIISENDPEKNSFSNPPDQREVSQFEDLAKGEFIYTATCMFRSRDFQKFPEQYYSLINNYTLDLHNAQYGEIKYINEVMSVYRKHSGGIWSMVARQQTLINQLPTYKFYLNYFDKKYRKYFLGHLKKMTAEIISLKLIGKDFDDWWKYYKDYLLYNFGDKKELRRMTAFFLRANYASISGLIKKK